ncbi:MAG: AraC family transcriptional regulator [Clostridiales bacterium]|nr:AraC family transcriptional regulator [Clostridiales bacterium]
MQDELQRKVEAQFTMSALKKCIHNHYEDLLNRIYEKGKSEEKVLIEDVKKYIRQHYTEDLSIKELADVACVSQNYFSAMFKKETGQNYKAYLTSLRMEEALRLLRETDDKTYEIAEQVGYNNVRRFVDAFKQIYSVSPMEYRKGLREK